MHPDLAEQERTWAQRRRGVTPGRVTQLLAGLGLGFVRLSPLEHSGNVNEALWVETDGPSLVLCLSSSHRLHKRDKTRSEVEVMRHMRHHTPVPVPEVLAFSDDAETSVLDCEFILMTKMAGIPLRSLWPSLAADERAAYAHQVKDIMDQLEAVPLPERRIGGFREGMKSGRLRGDRPDIGPFDSFAESLRQTIAWTDAALAEREDAAERPLRERLEALLKYMQAHPELLEEPEPPALHHGDLHGGNLLVDPTSARITALLDWEHAACGPPDGDWYSLRWAAERPTLGTTLRSLGIHPPERVRRRRRLLDAIDQALCSEFYIAAWYRAETDPSARAQTCASDRREHGERAIAQIDRLLARERS